MKIENVSSEEYMKKEESLVDNSFNNDDEKPYNNKLWPEVAYEIINKDNFLTIRETGDIWVYDTEKEFYINHGDTLIAEYCQSLIFACNRKSVLEITGTIKRSTYISAADLFESDVINILDGIIDPETLDITPHTPAKFSINKLPFNGNNQKYNLKLYNHILNIIDPEDINLFMELIWMFISKSNPFKKMVIFKGLTNTQKTTVSTIISWIIGPENFSYEKPQIFLSSKMRFATNKFIAKRGNIASEIGNLTPEHIENQKSLVGGEIQHTERKGDNTPYVFDPVKFTFLFTTNDLGKAYSEISDASIIGRYQFMIFRNQLQDGQMDGNWAENFFEDDEDRQSCIDTIVRFVINYKRAQKLGFQNKTKWSTVLETKRILEEEISIEDKYFREHRLVTQRGEKLSMDEIKRDFEEYTNIEISSQAMGYILRKNGFKTVQSNGLTVLKGFTFEKQENQTLV